MIEKTVKEMLAILKENGWAVKNVKAMSGGMEGDIVSCTIYKGGKKVGTMIDDATGGAYRYSWSNLRVGSELQALGKQYGYTDDFTREYLGGKVMEYGMDSLVYRLIAQYEFDREMRKACRKGVCFSIVGDEDGTYRSLPDMPFDAMVSEYLVKKYGDTIDKIFNKEYNINCA